MNKVLKKSAGRSTIGVVTKMTKKAWALSIVPLCISLYLMSLGVGYARMFAATDNSRWMFILSPIVVGVAIILSILFIGRFLVGVRITLTPTHINVAGRREKDCVAIPWRELVYTQNKIVGLVRVLNVAGGQGSASIYDLFTPGFDYMCKEVAKRKTYSISADSMGNMVIDSGRLGHL
jgi:hypothetical protein